MGTKPTLPDISEWQVQQLRLTAFPSPSTSLAHPKWWEELLGTEAETRNVRSGKGEITEQGPFEQGTLTLKVTPFRIDWTLDLRLDETLVDLDDDSMPSIGSFPDIGDKFTKLMHGWLSSATAPVLQRLAFGAVLLQPVDSYEDGYRLLSRYLTNIKLEASWQDFLYQVNKPRLSKVQELEGHSVNRLTKWSCASWQRRLVQMGSEGTKDVSGEKHYACRLELDLSTSGEFIGELPKTALASELSEQYQWGKEIAARGDIL